MKGAVQHINPEGLHKSPAYTQVVACTGPLKTVYIGGQNALDSSGKLVGKGDIAAQTEQVFKNLKLALAAAGAEMRHVIKWNIYAVHGQELGLGFKVFQQEWDRQASPPVITVLLVSSLANPDCLIEMDAVAVVPQDERTPTQQ